MNQQLTIEKMKMMRLKGMAQTHHANLEQQRYQDYTIDQYVSLLIDQEWECRQNRKTTNLLRRASFRINATVKNSPLSFPSLNGMNLLGKEQLLMLFWTD